MSETIKTGLQVFGLGIGIVIGMLILLMIVLYLLIPIFSNISQKKTKKTASPSPAAEKAPVSSAPVCEDESDTVAAIIAAISAFEGKAPESFRVVSFKRI